MQSSKSLEQTNSVDSVARSASVTIAEDDKTTIGDDKEKQIMSVDTVDTAVDADEKHVEDVIKRPILPYSNNVMEKSIIAELNSKFKTKDDGNGSPSDKAQPVPPSPSDSNSEPEERIRKKSLIPVYQGPNLNKNGSMAEDGERSLNQVINQNSNSEDSDLDRNSVSSIDRKSDVGSAQKSKIPVHQNSISGQNSSKDSDRNSTSSAEERSRKKSLIPVYQGSPSDRNSSEETEEDKNSMDRKAVNSKSKIPLSARSSSVDTNAKPMVAGSRASKPPKLPMLPSHPKPTSGVSPQTAPVSLNSTPTDVNVFSFKPSDPKESKLVTGETKSSAALKLPLLPSKPKPTPIVSQKSAPTLASNIPTDDGDAAPSFDSKVPQKSIRTQRLDDAIKELENEFKEERDLENKTLKLPMLPNKPKPSQADPDPPKTPPSSPADVKILSYKSLDQEDSKPSPLIAEAKTTKAPKLPMLPTKPKPSAPVSHKTAPILPSEVEVFRYTSLHEEVAPMSSPLVDGGEDSVTFSDKGDNKDSEKQQQSSSKIPKLSIPTSEEAKSSEQDQNFDEDTAHSLDARVPLPQKSIRTQRLDDALLELENELKDDEDLENEKRVKVTRRPTGHRHTMI